MPIPNELLSLKQFVVWKYETKPGEDKPTKVPYNPHTGARASSTNPETWGMIEDAQRAVGQGFYSGVGLVITKPFVGIDFDYCIDENGIIDPAIKEAVDWFSSYTEISPSGKGLHVLVKGSFQGPGFNRVVDGRKIEVYQEGRYFTLTGNQIQNVPSTIEDRTDFVRKFYAHIKERTQKPVGETPSGPRIELNLDDNEIIEKLNNATNGQKFGRLYAGDKSDYGNDDSRADEALCFLLAFYTKDFSQIDRIFRSSGLYRQKWERPDYRAATINNAINQVVEQYNPQHNSGKIIWGGQEFSKEARQREESKPPIITSSGIQIIDNENRTLNLTDTGNAIRLVRNFGSNIRFCNAWDKWMVWDGTRWKIDESESIVQMAKETARRILHEAAEADTKDLKNALIGWHKISESLPKIKAMIQLARSEPGVSIAVDALNSDPYLLNLKNGTLDLLTGELRPHRKDDLITKLAPVVYDRDEKAYVFEEFLQTIFSGSSELISFIRRAMGYSITASIDEQAIFVCYGTGANGKSTLLKLINKILGDYSASIPAEALMAKKYGQQNSYDIARLKDIRFVTTVEIDDGNRLSESLVKQLTGGDTISARFLYSNPFEFDPTFKIWMGVNHKPVITGTDNGIWRRVHLIPFEVTIPKDQQDEQLHEKLIAEASGVFNWILSGCLDWKGSGLQIPKEVKMATEGYRHDMDRLASFIEERCNIGDSFRISSSDLYRTYSQWCEQENIRPLDSKKFKTQMIEKGFQCPHTRTGKTFLGITVLSTTEF